MESDFSKIEKGELVFFVFAYGVTGLQCTLYVILISIPFFALFIFTDLAVEKAMYSSSPGLISYVVYFIFFYGTLYVMPSALGWFFAFLYPLKAKSQTWGMKLFGLKAVTNNGTPLTWKSALLQEGLMMFSCSFLAIGLLGVAWALFDAEEKTVFNKLSKINIIQDQPKLKLVEEFRNYRKNK